MNDHDPQLGVRADLNEELHFSNYSVFLMSAELQQGFRWGSYSPPGLWFFVMTEGAIRMVDPALSEQTWRPGEMYVMAAEQHPDSFHEVVETGRQSCVGVRFDLDALSQFLSPDEIAAAAHARRFVEAADGPAQRIARAMLAYGAHMSGRKLHIAARAMELADTILSMTIEISAKQARHGDAIVTPHDEQRIRALGDQIMADLSAPHSTSHLIHESGLSERRLANGFRFVFGMSPADYVTHKRMEHALVLLKERSLPVASVAYAVGYSPAHFSTKFRAHFGILPSQIALRT